MGFDCIDCKEREIWVFETYPKLCYECYISHHISSSEKKKYDSEYEKVKDNWRKLSTLKAKYIKKAFRDWNQKNNN